MRTFKNIVAVSFPVLLIALIITEWVLSTWFWIPDPYIFLKELSYNSHVPSEFPANVSYYNISEEGIDGLDRKMKFTTNNRGFRGERLIEPKPYNEYRVFLIGGSTAACYYQDDSKSLDRTIQDELSSSAVGKNIRVYNAGKPGDATPEHLSMLVNRVQHLQPDLIILFAGLNDFSRAVANYDYTHLKQNIFPGSIKFHQRLTKFQIARRLYHVFKQEKTNTELITMKTNYRSFAAYNSSFPVSDSIPHLLSAEYERNLRSFAGACLFNNIRLIFMSNQTTWNSRVDKDIARSHWLTYIGGIRYSEENLDHGLSKYNGVMEQVATELKLPFLPLHSILPKSKDIFYDDCHFTNYGAKITGDTLAHFIVAKGLIE